MIFEPAAPEWAGLARSHRAAWRPVLPEFESCRAGGEVVVRTGHQAWFWHAGILAKYFAAGACVAGLAAAGVAARAAQVVVDQDISDPWAVALPVEGGERVRVRLGPGPPAGVPTGSVPALANPACDKDLSEVRVLESARIGLGAIMAALTKERAAPSAAAQVAGALRRLMSPWVRLSPATYATGLSRESWFAALVGEMVRDARACVHAYNNAARMFPRARIRPLECNGARVELPLWKLTPGGVRRPVYAEEASQIAAGQLAPRALMLTASLRLAETDLFVHGLGGGVYERVTDAWIGAWRPGWRLAPCVVASATVHMPMEAGGLPRPEEIARAAWRAHRLRHDPAMAGDAELAAKKRALLGEIERCKAKGEDARALFRRMHALLEEHRAQNGEALSAARAVAARLALNAECAGVVYDRTWAFPLLPGVAVEALRGEILREFGVREAEFAAAGFTGPLEGDIV